MKKNMSIKICQNCNSGFVCHIGFTLTEVLLAIAILGLGMLFVASMFPLGIYFSALATEQTVAAVVADEAFAKIRLYGSTDSNWLSVLSSNACIDFNETLHINQSEFAYPSTDSNKFYKQYFWSALCRLTEVRDPVFNPNPPVQVTVFINRRIGSGLIPVSGRVGVNGRTGSYTLQVESDKENRINGGCTIVENRTGQIYRVRERFADAPNIIELDMPWQGGFSVWVVPSPDGGGRYPCVAIYQKVMKF